MTVKEFYDATGGGYEEMIAKFGKDSTITAFLNIFKRDASYKTLTEKLAEGDVHEAFAAAHTLKGVALNLNLVGLIDPVCSVVEALRAGDLQGAKEKFPALEGAYSKAVAALAVLLP